MEELKQASIEDLKNLDGIICPEFEIEIPVGDGQRKKVLWRRLGFSAQVYYKGSVKKAVKKALDAGILTTERAERTALSVKPDGKLKDFVVPHRSLKPETLKVYTGSSPKIPGVDYTYFPEFGLLSFSKAPKKGEDIGISYDYYEPGLYEELNNSAISATLIYLSAREINNPDKHVFGSIEDVEDGLTLVEINEILNGYFLRVVAASTEAGKKKLKDAPQQSSSSEGERSPKGTDSVPSPQKSGEPRQLEMKNGA